ncbi:MAG TPA: hypothetical protein VGD30_03140 [Telluria sp.]
MTIESDEHYALEMELRISRLEAKVGHIQRDIQQLKVETRALRSEMIGIRTTDFRLIFGAIITVALGLAGMMATGFGWL